MYRIEKSVFVKGKMLSAGDIVELDTESANILKAMKVAIEVEAVQEVEIKPKRRVKSK